jgi:hypothetical protein
MHYVIQPIWRNNLPNAYGVWRIPVRTRSVWGFEAVAVFETEQEARDFARNN